MNPFKVKCINNGPIDNKSDISDVLTVGSIYKVIGTSNVSYQIILNDHNYDRMWVYKNRFEVIDEQAITPQDLAYNYNVQQLEMALELAKKINKNKEREAMQKEWDEGSSRLLVLDTERIKIEKRLNELRRPLGYSTMD